MSNNNSVSRIVAESPNTQESVVDGNVEPNSVAHNFGATLEGSGVNAVIVADPPKPHTEGLISVQNLKNAVMTESSPPESKK